MTSGVGSLDSLDLLDLLFDRQDGILHGVELGTPPGAWHEDGVRPHPWVWQDSPIPTPCLAAGTAPPHGHPPWAPWGDRHAPLGTPG